MDRGFERFGAHEPLSAQFARIGIAALFRPRSEVLMNSAKRIVIAVLLTLVSTLSLAQQKAAPLTNDDILQMTKGGLQESTIISAIQVGETNFDLSVQNLLALRQAGVSDKVLDAMLAAQAAKKAPPQAVENSSAVLPAGVPSGGAMPMGLSPQMMASLPPAARQQMMAAISQMSRMGGMPGMMNGLMPGNMGGGSELLSTEQMPKVTMINGTDRKPMSSSMAQIAASTTKGGYKTGSSAG